MNAQDMDFDSAVPLSSIEPNQQRRHLRVIESIAAETQRPVQQVLSLYHEVLREMNEGAEIHDYLSIFVSRRVKRILHPQL
jgi:hypothetical protein